MIKDFFCLTEDAEDPSGQGIFMWDSSYMEERKWTGGDTGDRRTVSLFQTVPAAAQSQAAFFPSINPH